jgi:hypothetical protein
VTNGVKLGKIKGGHTTLPVNTERNGGRRMIKNEGKKLGKPMDFRRLTQPYAKKNFAESVDRVVPCRRNLRLHFHHRCWG